MTKAKRRRQKQRQSQSPGREQPQQEKREGLVRRLIRDAANHPLVVLSGLAVTVFGLWQIGVGLLLAFEPPLIEVTGSDPTSPFVMPFRVTNESWWFDMRDIQWRCTIPEMEFGQRNVLHMSPSGGIIRALGTHLLKPHESHNFQCGIRMPPFSVTSLQMNVSMSYRTWRKRRTATKPFYWVTGGARPQWIEGNGID